MKHIIDMFKQAIAKNRLSHLYLLYGSSGMTKSRAALDVAYEIFKSHHDTPHLKTQIDNFNYPNLWMIKKEGQSIKKEQVIALQDEFSKTSLLEGPRVFIIEDIETMSVAAANSLLKFLEEPKGLQTTGFLITSAIEQVLPTIISRSQLLRIEDMDDLSFQDILIENDIVEDDVYILPLLTKDIQEAISFSYDTDYQAVVMLFKTTVNDWMKNKVPLTLLLAERSDILFSDKKWVSLYLNLLIKFLLDVIHTHMNQGIYFESMREDILFVVRNMDAKRAEKMIQIIQETLFHHRVYVNLTLSLQAMAYKLERLAS